MQLVSAQEQSDAVLTVHVVQRGENLFRIALQYDLFADEVAEANGISNSESISVGQRLIIPLISDTPLSFLTHTVAAGETLESIARYYGKSIDELMNLNSLTALGEIFLGQELIVVAGDEGAIPESTAEPDSAILSTPADAASVSNRTSLIIGDPDFAFVHVVEAGDTVFDIGLRYNQTVSTVAQANNLLDATKIFIGQKLIIPGIEPPRLAQDLPENVSSFTIDPLILVEGRTGRIEIRTTEVVTLSGKLFGSRAENYRARKRDPTLGFCRHSHVYRTGCLSPAVAPDRQRWSLCTCGRQSASCRRRLWTSEYQDR